MHKQKGKEIKAAWAIQSIGQTDEPRGRRASQDGAHQSTGRPLSDPHRTQSQEQREAPKSTCYKANVLSNEELCRERTMNHQEPIFKRLKFNKGYKTHRPKLEYNGNSDQDEQESTPILMGKETMQSKKK